MFSGTEEVDRNHLLLKIIVLCALGKRDVACTGFSLVAVVGLPCKYGGSLDILQGLTLITLTLGPTVVTTP